MAVRPTPRIVWIIGSGIFRSNAMRMWARLTSREWCTPRERKISSFSRSRGFNANSVCRIDPHNDVSLIMCQCTSIGPLFLGHVVVRQEGFFFHPRQVAPPLLRRHRLTDLEKVMKHHPLTFRAQPSCLHQG